MKPINCLKPTLKTIVLVISSHKKEIGTQRYFIAVMIRCERAQVASSSIGPTQRFGGDRPFFLRYVDQKVGVKTLDKVS